MLQSSDQNTLFITLTRKRIMYMYGLRVCMYLQEQKNKGKKIYFLKLAGTTLKSNIQNNHVYQKEKLLKAYVCV